MLPRSRVIKGQRSKRREAQGRKRMTTGLGRLAAGIAAVVAFGVATAAAQTTVTFRFNDPEAPVMRQALDEFEKQNPDIKVTMQRVTWADAQQQFLREAAVGTAPDVAQLAQVWPRSFGKAGALRPLDDLIKKTDVGVAGWDQFIAREMQVGPDGKVYGIPFTIDTFAMVYNKDLLKAAGYNQFFKDGDNPRSHLSICLWSAPEIVEGMASGNIAIASVPDAVGVQIVNTWKQRNPGKPSPLAAAIHPADVNGSKTFFGGRSLGISANSKTVEQSWKLIRFLSTPDPTFTKYYTNYVQPQRAVMTYDRLPAEIAPGFTDQLQRARTWGPYGLGPVAIPFMWNAVGRAAGSVFIGDKTAKVARAELHDAISKELAN